MAKKKRIKQSRINRRVDVAPECGPMASLGYHALEVQKVITKWRDEKPVTERINAEDLDRYFVGVAMATVHRQTALENLPKFVPPNHWHAIFELGNALCGVLSDKETITAWLIGGRWSCAVNGKWPNAGQIASEIRKSGGPCFTPAAIRKAQDRLGLSTPAHIAKEFLDTWPNTPTE